jgi:ribosome-associated protein
VHKVSSAAHLRFDVAASSLPDEVKTRLLAQADQRIASAGVIVIKAQEHRSLPMNQAEALARLQAMVDRAAFVPKVRRATRPTRGSQRRRLDSKASHGKLKATRRSPLD